MNRREPAEIVSGMEEMLVWAKEHDAHYTQAREEMAQIVAGQGEKQEEPQNE